MRNPKPMYLSTVNRVKMFGRILLFFCLTITSIYCKVEIKFSENSSHRHNNDSSEKFTEFLHSINEVSLETNAKFSAIGKKIQMIRVELNQSSSICYQTIEKTFQNGIDSEWSSKCKYFRKLLNQN